MWNEVWRLRSRLLVICAFAVVAQARFAATLLASLTLCTCYVWGEGLNSGNMRLSNRRGVLRGVSLFRFAFIMDIGKGISEGVFISELWTRCIVTSKEETLDV